MPHPSAFVPGTLLEGRYRIVAQLGRGGMGEVYRADDLRLGQSVALKFLPAELEHDEEARERLLAEVRLARTIAHPNVCKVYDVGDLPAGDGRPSRAFITMEYIDGEDLATLLRRIGRLPAAKALDIARQLCAGIAAAHDKGVLHRDLKPANVMLDGRGQVKIADFGIAVDASQGDASADNAGTMAYMAPERFYGEPASVRSDLYALGLILYETVTGLAALTVNSPLEWAAAHAVSMPTDPSALASDVDPLLSRVILRCLEKEPGKRPSSAAQVAAALPGGDPLAAALAAGETPSPELVAASGEEGTLTRGKAIAWFIAAVASFGFALWVTAPALLINQLPMRFSTEALEQRSREMLVSFGHATPPVDWASEWVRGTGVDSMSIQFRYREDPEELVPLIGAGPLELAADYPESARLLLDSDGRLLHLDVGGARSYSDTTPQREPNWVPLFAAIGVEGTPAPTSARRWPPAYFADTRAAWTGTIKGVPSEIEAAGLRGRITSVRIRPRGVPDEAAVPPLSWVSSGAGIIVGVILVVLILLGVLARRNARLGRGDRRGATRLAVFILVALFVDTLLNRHWYFSPAAVLYGSFYSIYFPLFLAAVSWVCYLGLEPFVRRRWPSLLVGWTRLLDGRFRDGLVGQAILVGIVGGSLGLNIAMGSTVSRAIGVPTAFYFPYWAESMWFRYAALTVASGAFYVGVLVASRMLLRRDWAAWCAISLFFFVGFASGSWGQPLPVFVVSAILPTFVSIGLLYRFGFLTFVVASFVGRVIAASSISHDPSRWYFWHAAPAILIVLSLATWGFLNVLGRKALLPEGALD